MKKKIALALVGAALATKPGRFVLAMPAWLIAEFDYAEGLLEEARHYERIGNKIAGVKTGTSQFTTARP